MMDLLFPKKLWKKRMMMGSNKLKMVYLYTDKSPIH